MEPNALQITWFLLVGALIAGYAVLDGFDLGVGVLSLFGKSPEERRLHINAIAPVWDGNEVWLVTAGGALFAAFPPVYASVFSGFYLAFMLLLVALIFRAVSMEFRGKVDSDRWRRLWDWGFGLGSLLPGLLFGVTVGNLLMGLPLDAAGNYTGTFIDLLHPYPLIIGLLSLVMFTCHGAHYMAMKSEGELAERMRRWASGAWMAWVVLFAAASLFTFFIAPARMHGLTGNPLFWIVLLALFGALVGMALGLRSAKGGLAFGLSSLAIVAQVALVGLSLYPNLVPGVGAEGLSLSIANASSSDTSLTTMLIIAGVGMPFVLAYTIVIYRIFKGKVVIGPDSY
jgi:cytochrome d ubiquinol oxidase subunit II